MSIKSIKLPNPNAVLYKDMQIKVKHQKLVLLVFIVNLILTIVAVAVMSSMAVGAVNFETVDYSSLTTMFIVLACVEYGFIALLAPALTAGSITMEREKQTFEVLLTTKLTPWQIVTGKYWSSILEVLLLIFSGLPVFSLVFIYGGVSFFQALAIIFLMMCNAMVLAAFGIYSSAVSKKSISATVLAYLSVLLIYFGTMTGASILKSVFELIDDARFAETGIHGFNGDAFMFLLYFNPLTSFYDALSRIFGIDLLDYYSNSSAAGMAELVADVTDYSITNFLLTLWTPISLVIQGLMSFGLLRSASRHIDPLRKRKAKKVKHAKRVQEKTA